VTAHLIKTPILLGKSWWDAVSQTFRITPQVSAMIGFSVRTYLASMMALGIAFALQLDSPYWAWVTVWIVSQGTPGVTLSKGLFRAIGTIMGSICAIVLIALFAQTPELFVLALAVLVGLCTVGSNLLTNFRSYATALTAYTAGIIAADAINAPSQVFFIAMARTACILLGIASAVVVTAIFAPHRADEQVRAKLLVVLKDIAQRAAYPWTGSNERRMTMGRKLITEIIDLNSLIEYAAAESAWFRIEAHHATSMLAHIFGIISARRALDAHLVRCGWPEHNALEIFHEVILDFLAEMPARLDKGEVEELISGLRDVREQLELLRPEFETSTSTELVSERLVIDRLDDLLCGLNGALEDWNDILHSRWSNEPRLTLNFHRDVRLAWINGLRAFVAVCATGAFWIGSAWSSGPGALVFVAIILSLFSSQPRPDKVGWAFFYASLPATALGLICKYLFLSAGSGFEFLAVATSLFLLPVGVCIAYPPTAFFATAFSLVFLNLVAPTNPMVYDLAASFNTALATIVGVLFGTLAYVLIYPPDPAAARRYVTYRIRRGLEIISFLNPVPVTSAHWETRMYDRVMRLNDAQNPSGTPTDEWLDAGLGALNLGNELLRLRRFLESETMSGEVRAATTKVIAGFGRFLPEPQRTVEIVQEQARRLSGLDPGPGVPERKAWARVLGALGEMESYLVAHPRLTKAQSIT
jgi:uncharacterized membrane protein YccC